MVGVSPLWNAGPVGRNRVSRYTTGERLDERSYRYGRLADPWHRHAEVVVHR
jgi:hypothetical protein